MFAKIYSLLSLLDDTYDVHATLDECHKLTEAIRRRLADGMIVHLRKFYLRLLGTLEDFEDELQPKERYRVAYNSKAVKVLSESYLQEAKWSHDNCKPTFKQQAKVYTVRGIYLGYTHGRTLQATNGLGRLLSKKAEDALVI
ncbi:hypothetical protein BAE44_0006834 [Dichanthelium oligosanthes]|uniref:Terpene synthase metal-binding domain-containing protein n=1 Tax=Dichanthelium oligosanthes TaxID=888268 RepID=A0A1E5W424_9POAL|nr:hypothetical protein BAE44_0006834 [Dichanthelium oligosanthes]